MPIREDTRYRVTRRLELARRKFLWWNRHEVGDIFRHIKKVEADIMELQHRKDWEGGLQDFDLKTLCHRFSVHHSLLSSRRFCRDKSLKCDRNIRLIDND